MYIDMFSIPAVYELLPDHVVVRLIRVFLSLDQCYEFFQNFCEIFFWLAICKV